ncbi:hypothetical protein [Photorhabdus bodei]|uniref:Uncharacterized protein n=2 Tax=Photorhabdus TaxID=29487 RepID=A0A329X3K5_9GAMM|nr:hypothetical protein [Photorhabdus bodei]NDL00355.1 hypothetical protein [Photorhabdus bodei]NDL04416.1 hypothetical protein [Photorhabdus bodei]NDL08814.1 hypothetical protein [Photorhabdus bodei]RAX11489.1 hypothetical protein CKY02_13410 [Photorhabdus bodei]
MTLKEFISDLGLTVPQFIAAIPVFIVLLNLLFKALKSHFKLINMITNDKYSILPVNKKTEAIGLIYQEIHDNNKIENYSRELKLADYGLKYPIITLQFCFDYLYSKQKLSVQSSAYDFLKQDKIFLKKRNELPVVSQKRLFFSVGILLVLICLSVGEFITGIQGITETIHSKANWESGSKLCLFLFVEVLLVHLILIFFCEIGSIVKAIYFSKKLHAFYNKQLCKKYKS